MRSSIGKAGQAMFSAKTRIAACVLLVSVITGLATNAATAQEAGAPVPKPPIKPLDNATINAGLNPSDPRIQAFVAYLRRHGVTLIYHDGSDNKSGPGWRV